MHSGESAVGLVFPISVAEVIMTRKRSVVSSFRGLSRAKRVFGRTICNTDKSQAALYHSAREANRIGEIDLVLGKKLNDGLVRVVLRCAEY